MSEPATMEFAEAGTVDVFSGCNDQVFSYEIDGDTLAFTLVSTTGQACSGTAGELSGHVSEVLGDRVTFEIDAQRLTLTNGDVGLGATTD